MRDPYVESTLAFLMKHVPWLWHEFAAWMLREVCQDQPPECIAIAELHDRWRSISGRGVGSLRRSLLNPPVVGLGTFSRASMNPARFKRPWLHILFLGLHVRLLSRRVCWFQRILPLCGQLMPLLVLLLQQARPSVGFFQMMPNSLRGLR